MYERKSREVEMVRIALIGAGNHCRGNHAPAMAKYAADHPDRVELSAVCDLEREKAEGFAKEFGFKAVYTDLDEMLDREKPDGCVAVMPVQLIVAMASDLMRRGMPATVEKPPGISLEEARTLVQVAEETGTPHMVSVNRRFTPNLQRAKAWAKEQGDLRYVRGSMLRHNRKEEQFISGTGIHIIDAMREIGGEVTSYRGRRMTTGEADWFHIVLEYASGAVGSIDILPTDGVVEERYELFGDGFRVDTRVEHSPSPMFRCWKDGQMVVDDVPPEEDPQFVRVGPYAEMHEFVSGLAEGRPLWPTVQEVFPSMEIAYGLAAQE